ncbi:MAG: hypothetical protein IJM30_08195 [Thermoguttaceae bacterium]|nr:hypothetical protein [Thermoguttaceae bacterium]
MKGGLQTNGDFEVLGFFIMAAVVICVRPLLRLLMLALAIVAATVKRYSDDSWR